eukprot:jgi/Chlat1/3810/Chrsp259S03937
MPGRATKGKGGNKQKVKKDKKDEKAGAPSILECHVRLPSGHIIELKGISTDTVADVRRMLSVHVDTCHQTNYSLRHEVRGVLSDDYEIATLKPYLLELEEEEYTAASALENVRRLLDILSGLSCFGKAAEAVPFASTSQPANSSAGSQQVPVLEAETSTSGRSEKEGSDKAKAAVLKQAEDALRPDNAQSAIERSDEEGEGCITVVPSQLGDFYRSFAINADRPIQSLQRSLKLKASDTDFLHLDIVLCDGKLIPVSACSEGFFVSGKPAITEHTLVALLKTQSRPFAKAYTAVMKAFLDRNRFGNIPVGLRANTWVVPPSFADTPGSPQPLPLEDMEMGGDGGGGCFSGRNSDALGVEQDRFWRAELELIASMPGATPEERLIRDRRLFLVHSAFVETALRRACALIDEVERAQSADESELTTHGMRLTVAREPSTPPVGGSAAPLAGNVLKGLTADEHTQVQDTEALCQVTVHHHGYVVKINALEVKPPHVALRPEQDEPAARNHGAGALNANSLRILLHAAESPAPAEDSSVTSSNHSAHIGLAEAEIIVARLLDTFNAATVENQANVQLRLRWELAQNWMQHLTAAKEKHEADTQPTSMDTEESSTPQEQQAHAELLQLLTPEQLAKLKAADLHQQSVSELVEAAQKYYDETAVSKFVAELGSLELSPVDGRTLSDFMHARGLHMCSLAALARQANHMVHVRVLAVNEMITRSIKHVLRAALAAAPAQLKASVIAIALNAAFGSNSNPLGDKIWSTIFALVGIEVAPSNYDFKSAHPFSPRDIISCYPVFSYVAYTSHDGRVWLEQAKAALDKGKLDDAVHHATRALAQLIGVVGRHHRVAAGAYSLLAVVLYHTGDFSQAAVIQGRALDICEREIGLDHPDTIKSYGDLAVFYYRLHHTALALQYVQRALYLLHLTCGPAHPNTAATYINVAMMEEGLGHVHLALRYLHEALKCNQRLLGPDHIQTAASYHAIAIALSLMDAYSLSVQHEQTTLNILQAKLGLDDLRTQDAAAWLEYFESKALEQAEAARTGAPRPDPNIAIRGHLSVDDLLKFIKGDEATVLIDTLESPKRRRNKAKSPKAISAPVVADSSPANSVVAMSITSADSSSTYARSNGSEVLDEVVAMTQSPTVGKQTQLQPMEVANVNGSIDNNNNNNTADVEEGEWQAISGLRRRQRQPRVVVHRPQRRDMRSGNRHGLTVHIQTSSSHKHAAHATSTSRSKPRALPASAPDSETTSANNIIQVSVTPPVTMPLPPAPAKGLVTSKSWKDVASALHPSSLPPRPASAAAPSALVFQPLPPRPSSAAASAPDQQQNESSTELEAVTSDELEAAKEPASTDAVVLDSDQRQPESAPVEVVAFVEIDETDQMVANTPVAANLPESLMSDDGTNASEASDAQHSSVAEREDLADHVASSPIDSSPPASPVTPPAMPPTPISPNKFNIMAPEFVPARIMFGRKESMTPPPGGSTSPVRMNPNAAEFVPGRYWKPVVATSEMPTTTSEPVSSQVPQQRASDVTTTAPSAPPPEAEVDDGVSAVQSSTTSSPMNVTTPESTPEEVAAAESTIPSGQAAPMVVTQPNAWESNQLRLVAAKPATTSAAALPEQKTPVVSNGNSARTQDTQMQTEKSEEASSDGFTLVTKRRRRVSKSHDDAGVRVNSKRPNSDGWREAPRQHMQSMQVVRVF